MVSEAGLKQFKKLYKQEFGIVLSRKELIEKANRLLNLYKAVYVTDSKKIRISTEHETQTQPQEN